ncbi:MAG: phosphatase PAP2 family protein [Sphingomonadales bacterium]|nr:phosphatase PAP2 family protein [Sphingomonadales bacterium]
MLALAALASQPALAQTAAPAAAPAAAPKHVLHYLDAATLTPALMLPPAPERGSAREKLELETLHRMIAAASPERLKLAAADSDNEDPSIFNAAMGHDLRKLPATWALLSAVQEEIDVTIGMAKQSFGRLRPYGVDATMPTCVPVNRDKPARAYPSGHAGLGWGVGWFLVRLAPAKAAAILGRADDYAISRQLCGVHFPSDTEASHMLGTVVAERLLSDPRLAPQIAAARAELAAAN